MATLECEVDVENQVAGCRDAIPIGLPTGISAALLGLNQIRLVASNHFHDATAGFYAYDVTMQNLLTQPIGTPDGSIREGGKVFFERGPTPKYHSPGDTGTVSLRNADETASYTAANQPFFQYDTILLPQETSDPRRWEYNVPPTVRSFTFVVKVFTATPTENRVPAVAPDHIPDGFYGSTNIMLHSPYFPISDMVVKNVVAVRFEPWASRDERQAAVDVIRGRVVGGHRLSGVEGSYFIEIVDDGTGAMMSAAVDTLATLPTVANAGAEMLSLPEEWLAHIRPTDEGAWAGPWQLNASHANGSNWGAEAVAAPHAWGCTVGTSATKVAVLDVGYFSNSDLLPNVTYAPSMDEYNNLLPWLRNAHGTNVASVLAAAGNNGDGITGIMWKADLRLYEVSLWNSDDRSTLRRMIGGGGNTPKPMERIVQERLHQAIHSGADIVNMSLQSKAYADSFPDGPDGNWHRQISYTVNELAHVIRQAQNRPLIVIAAGNYDKDAYWSTLPLLAKHFPEQVIVVAGVSGVDDDSGTRWTESSYNTTEPGFEDLVQIAGPAFNVGVLGRTGRETVSGTSFTAPHVAGIAGLLKSFDSRLTSKELKELLLAGAQRGGRLVGMSGDVYVANAYASLSAAAERPGAPLCGGMPVWRDQEFGLVQGRRLVGNTPGTFTSLFPHTGSALIPMHGETTIRADESFYGWFDGSWAQVIPRDDVLGNASNRSKLGRSHDGDSTLTINRIELSDTREIYQVFINGQLLRADTSTWAEKPSTTLCVVYHRTNPGCSAEIVAWKDRVMTHTALGYSPRGDEVVLAISRQLSSQFVVDTPYPCLTSYYCQDYEFTVRTLASELVFIGVADGHVRERRPGPFQMIKRIGYSEDGQRLVLENEYTYYDHQHNTSGGTSPAPINNWYCNAQYITRSSPTVFLATLPLKRQVANCYTTATFSP